MIQTPNQFYKLNYSKYWLSKRPLGYINTEFDEFTLDMKVRRPIDIQKNIKFIKFIINNENIFNKVSELDNY